MTWHTNRMYKMSYIKAINCNSCTSTVGVNGELLSDTYVIFV